MLLKSKIILVIFFCFLSFSCNIRKQKYIYCDSESSYKNLSPIQEDDYELLNNNAESKSFISNKKNCLCCFSFTLFFYFLFIDYIYNYQTDNVNYHSNKIYNNLTDIAKLSSSVALRNKADLEIFVDINNITQNNTIQNDTITSSDFYQNTQKMLDDKFIINTSFNKLNKLKDNKCKLSKFIIIWNHKAGGYIKSFLPKIKKFAL